MVEINVLYFVYAFGVFSGMVMVWAFGLAHDIIINNYRKMVYNRKLKQEREQLSREENL